MRGPKKPTVQTHAVVAIEPEEAAACGFWSSFSRTGLYLFVLPSAINWRAERRID